MWLFLFRYVIGCITSSMYNYELGDILSCADPTGWRGERGGRILGREVRMVFGVSGVWWV